MHRNRISLFFIHAEESGNVLEVGKGGGKTNETDKFIGLLYTMSGAGSNGLENRGKIRELKGDLNAYARR